MPFYFIIWDDDNEQHVAEHGVTPAEFEEVVIDPDRVDESRSSGRNIAFGRTSTGKRLACVYEMLDDVTIYPTTAYELDA
jgi:uncharacterized DUF497 family protein